VEPLLLVRNDPVDTLGIARRLLETQIPVVAIDAWETPFPPLESISGVVAFGGSMNVDQTRRYPYLSEERAFVRACVNRGMPVLGICLGAQLLARALGAEVTKAPLREIGFTTIHPTPAGTTDPILASFVDGDLVFHWHEDTFELPVGGELLATGDAIVMQAFRAGARAWGIQFHLEIDRREIELWFDDAGEDVERTWGKSRETVLAEADRYLAEQTERARNAFARFAAIARESESAIA
jgi:GMP synthase (glutamine-hydrolysing)